MKTLDCLLGCSEGPGCSRHYSQCLTLFRSLLAILPGTSQCISPTAILKNLLLQIGIRGDRLCILVSSLLDAFVTALHLRRTHQGHSINFHQLMHGRIQIMTALCPALAHAYQTIWWGFCPEQLKPEAFSLLKAQEKFPKPPRCRTITRLTGNDSPDWRHFTDGGFERQVDGSDLADWRIAFVSPDNVVRLLFGPVMRVILAIWHFQEPPRAATTFLAAKRYVFLFRFKACGSCYLWC